MTNESGIIEDLFNDGVKVKTINRISMLYGVTTRTLRFYEDRGLLSPIRDGTNRYYQPHDEVRLQVILQGKKFGFSLMQIKTLLCLDVNQSALSLSKAQFEDQLASLTAERTNINAALDELYEAKRIMEESAETANSD